VPTTNAFVVHVATPELTARVAQPVIETPPSSKFTVPLAPGVTVAMNVTAAPTFWGDGSLAPSATEDEARDGVAGAELLDGLLVPPALVAVTLKVSAVPAGRPGTVHEVLVAATVQVWPPGLAVTV
jgi:hypothetical protein